MTTLCLAEHEVIEVEVHTARRTYQVFNIYRGFAYHSNFYLTPLLHPEAGLVT
jgi:hypothetical protein